jgi:hypothetical protein
MVGARIIFPEFRDEQADSRYPFADTATLKADTGVELPRDGIIDAVVYPIGGSAAAYISAVVITATTVTIEIGSNTTTFTCAATYSALKPPVTGVLALYDSYGRPAGLLLFTEVALQLMASWGETTHTFQRAATEFVASVVIPAQEPGVRGILTPSGELLTGDVWLIGDRGVVLRQTARNTIRVDIVGAPLFKRVDCVDSVGENVGVFRPKTFIKTINGISPDKFGNFNLTIAAKSTNGSIITDSILRIYPENNALKIEAVGNKVL